MMNFFYIFMAGVLGVVSFFTGEIVSYELLGFIWIALNNILKVLQDISGKMDQKE